MPGTTLVMAILLCPPAVLAGPFSVLLDEVVAVVAGKFQGGVPPRVITRWDLESECRLESIVRYGAAGVDRPISKSLRASVLDRIIDESVIFREAARLEGAMVDEAEVDEAFEQLASELASAGEMGGLLESAGLVEQKVRAILERRIVVDRYVLDNLRLTMSFTDSELESAFETMDHPYKDSVLDDVREEFREYLLAETSHQHRDGLIDDLASRCHIWIFWSPGSVEAG